MVDTTLYCLNETTQRWKKESEASHIKGGTHAERAAYNKIKIKEATSVYKFVQDAIPCSECHKFFKEESTKNKSFIFHITAAKYTVPVDVKVSVTRMDDPDPDEDSFRPEPSYRPKSVVLNDIPRGWRDGDYLDPGDLPICLYYFNGVAFLGARPNNFPRHPPVIQG
jgi:hypothetical protein